MIVMRYPSSKPASGLEPKDYVYGIHAVIESLEAGKEIDKLLVAKSANNEQVKEVLEKARRLRVPVLRVPVERLDRITRRSHQGVIALLAAVTYYRLDHLLPQLFEEGSNPFIVVLDGITDVRNFGAIARTCECAGVNAIVIPDHGSVGVNADALKTSAGALNYLPVCREHNLAAAVRLLHDSGLTVVGTSDSQSVPYTEIDYTRPVALVLGSENQGISPAISALCDHYVAIPEFGQINSLNVSVAGGVMMYEVVRQRLADNQSVI